MMSFMYEGKTYDATTMHTKQLIRILREVRHYMSDNYLYDDIVEESLEREYEEIIMKLKTELAKREHVPNKVEAKEIRKQKMNEKRNR